MNTDMNTLSKANMSSTSSNKYDGQPMIAVYCGSKIGVNPCYAEASYTLGQSLVHAGMGVIYGGASIGLMGQVANGALEEKGTVIGVIPQFLLDYEVGHEHLTECHIVATMHERKAIMEEEASAFITLPGGIGTLEEIMEIATWNQLALHCKPMIILNIDGFYNHLLAHLKFAVEQGFMSLEDYNKLIVCNTVEETIAVLKERLLP